ncbi:uncharacterized protein LOC144126328 [Amblyomma americanum]
MSSAHAVSFVEQHLVLRHEHVSNMKRYFSGTRGDPDLAPGSGFLAPTSSPVPAPPAGSRPPSQNAAPDRRPVAYFEDLVAQCTKCAETRVVRSEPLMPTPTPERPWQHLGIDLFQFKERDYVLIVDYYSRFPEVVTLGTTAATAITAAVKSCFARFWIPNVVRTDNRPQFVSNDFTEFPRSYGFRHETSSPRYPQSNGEAERMVRTVKDLLEKSSDPYLALLTYRDTPGVSGVSPAQLLMGRKLQTRLPGLPERLLPALPSNETFRAQDSATKVQQGNNYNCSHSASPLSPLKPGDDVRVKDIGCSGRVLSPAQRPRSYVVETPGCILQRNRHLVRFSTGQNIPEQAATSPSKLERLQQSSSCSLPVGPLRVPSSPEIQRSPEEESSPQLQEQVRMRYGRAVRPPLMLH